MGTKRNEERNIRRKKGNISFKLEGLKVTPKKRGRKTVKYSLDVTVLYQTA